MIELKEDTETKLPTGMQSQRAREAVKAYMRALPFTPQDVLVSFWCDDRFYGIVRVTRPEIQTWVDPFGDLVPEKTVLP